MNSFLRICKTLTYLSKIYESILCIPKYIKAFFAYLNTSKHSLHTLSHNCEVPKHLKVLRNVVARDISTSGQGICNYT